MINWRDAPALVQQLDHAAPGSTLERRTAILDALYWRRQAGFKIGYSRIKGAQGYYIRRASLPESYRIVFDQLDREMDLEHLDRVAKLSGEQRLEKMFELMDFLHAVWEAGQREREQIG